MISIVLVLAAAIVTAQPASADLGGGLLQPTPPCAAPSVPGGDWSMYGHDLSNTRAQPAETALGPIAAATLAPRWEFDTGHPSSVVGFVDLNSTPVVARGCVYAGDAGGDIFALEASTGALVWRRHFDVSAPGSGFNAGTVVGTVQVAGDRVIAVIDQADAPYVVALDASTGATRWTSPPIDTQPGAFTHGSAIVYRDVVFVGFSGPEGVVTAQGGFAVLDLTSGVRLAHTYTIPVADRPSGSAAAAFGAHLRSTARPRTRTSAREIRTARRSSTPAPTPS